MVEINRGIITDTATVVMQPELTGNYRAIERDIREFNIDKVGRSKLRRNSNLSELDNIDKYLDDIYQVNKHTVCLCDTDMFIIEISRLKAYIGKHITREFFETINKKKMIHLTKVSDCEFIPVVNDDNTIEIVEQFICPIESKEEVVGAIVIVTKLSDEYDSQNIDSEEMKLAKNAAEALSKQVRHIKINN